MTGSAQRYRKWMMAAGPGMALAGRRFGSLAAAAFLLLWMLLGAALPGVSHLPYAPRRRLRPHRLFLGYAAGTAMLCALVEAGKRLWPGDGSSVPLTIGAVCFSLIFGQRMVRLAWPRALSWGLGGVLCAASLAAAW